MEYAAIRDVPRLDSSGHKNIRSIRVFVNLQKKDPFCSAIAKTAEDAGSLVESGFECASSTPDHLTLFRK